MRPDAGVWRKATRRATRGISRGRRTTHKAQPNLAQRGSTWARRHPGGASRAVISVLKLHTMEQVLVPDGPEAADVLDVCSYCCEQLALPTRGRPMGVMYEPYPCATIRAVLPYGVLWPRAPRSWSRDPWAERAS